MMKVIEFSGVGLNRIWVEAEPHVPGGEIRLTLIVFKVYVILPHK
jgi:hypothetical protein